MDVRHETTGTYRIHRYPSALIDRIALADGRRVTVRPVLPQDADAEQTFVSSLSPISRQRRFHLGVNELPESLLRSFTEVDYRTHVALIAESVDEDGESIIVADARYVVDEDGAEGEFGIAVADDWNGVGLGSALMQRLATHARRSGLRQLYGDVLAGNAPMLALVRRLGGRIVFHPDDDALLRTCFAL